MKGGQPMKADVMLGVFVSAIILGIALVMKKVAANKTFTVTL